VICRKMKS